MRRIIPLLGLLLLPLLAMAQQIDTRGLSKEQTAEIAAQVAKMKSPEGQVEGVSAAVRKETAAWASLGSNIGTAMVSAAKELGLAANEFAQTNLGRVVTAIVVYKVVGRDFLGVIVGAGIMLFGYGLIIWVFMTRRFGDCKYEYHPVLWGMFQRQKLVEYKVSDDAVLYRFWFAVALAIATTAVGLNTIF